MSLGTFHYSRPQNEPTYSYAPGTKERIALQEAIKALKSKEVEIPMYIGAEEVTTGKKIAIHPPHEIAHTLGYFHFGDTSHVEKAIEAAKAAKPNWENMPWEERAAIFLRAADLFATKYRFELNAATMLCQSKNPFQAEIDAGNELVDFLRFNVHFLSEIYAEQPASSTGTYNRTEWRPLEGFVLAVTPFNFTAIAGNLPCAPALCGNTVVWKPADAQVYSAQIVMKVLKEAGLPDGVINLIYVDGKELGDVCFSHHDFAGVHFTGSSAVFKTIWKNIGTNVDKFRTFPRIVGETGGKDFVLIHKSAAVDSSVVALARGAFEYQGQKCSAASRAYIPSNLADEILEKLVAMVKTFTIGTVEDFSNYINAVIHEQSFDKIASYIETAKAASDAEIIVGGTYDKSKGYFVSPTVIKTTNKDFVTLSEEIFGPVLTVYVYDENEFEEIIKVVDSTSPYALTGSILATDRNAVAYATQHLRNAAGNFYVNDKPTGAVVGQQPFGGARASGTNDKAGSKLNMYRWLSARSIKETFNPPTDYTYPFLQKD
ncbi:L-glutamate gamma-semialdehyde dehydrogenase [Rhizosphaericola mali]|uniref:L-glutamate gamma-semialdehyde dehydrogenase n=1 Tax=Rhizosphaericola mali TaxID=2545455 RepID=A0A5P2FYL5_9BACT|nr:L-glutamate gamma-semialdehyde dehydrogenase [Rhizosphaericola mali]QES88634.1 L-glutamate gamma-semialdehyde dehydrogenase [Rhizosphaericola mali]